MTTEIATRRRKKGDTYSLEDIELSLTVLALHATHYEPAAQVLNQQGIPVSKQLLWQWANERHTARFEEIKTEIHAQVADRVASQAEQVMLEAGELELDLIARLRAQADQLKPADLATALRNVTTTKALNNDKISAPIRGRPNVITQDRTAEEIFRALKALEPGLVIDSTAIEITEGEADIEHGDASSA